MRTSFTPSVNQLTLLCYMTRDYSLLQKSLIWRTQAFFALSYCPYCLPVFYASCLGAITLYNWPIWKKRLVRVKDGEICSDCKIKCPFWSLLMISNWTFISWSFILLVAATLSRSLTLLTWIGLNEMKKMYILLILLLCDFIVGVKVKHCILLST